MPITIAMVAVLAILLFSYRQTIKAYPSADGAYIVTKDNLGLLPAQVAGAAALYSAVPSMYAWRVPITLVFIALIARGNLRGASPNNSPRYRT